MPKVGERGFATYAVLKRLAHVGNQFRLGALLRGSRFVVDQEQGIATIVFTYLSHLQRFNEEMEELEIRDKVYEAFEFVYGVKHLHSDLKSDAAEEVLPW